MAAQTLATLYSPQKKAVQVGGSKFKTPLSAIIHAELPGKIEEGRVTHEVGQFEEGLATDKAIAEKSLKQSKEMTLADISARGIESKEALTESSRQHKETLDQRKEELRIAGEEAQKAEGIKLGTLGVTGAYTLYKMGGAAGQYGTGPAAGFGVGYGVKRYTGSSTKGAAAGTAAGVAAGYYANMQTAMGPTVGSILGGAIGFLGGLL